MADVHDKATRRFLHANGFRHRLHVKDLPSIVFWTEICWRFHGKIQTLRDGETPTKISFFSC